MDRLSWFMVLSHAEYWVMGLRHGQAVLVHGPGTCRVLGYGVTAWTGCPSSWSCHMQSTGLRGYGMDRLSWFMVLAHAEYWVTGLRHGQAVLVHGPGTCRVLGYGVTAWKGCPGSWSCHMQSTGLRGYGMDRLSWFMVLAHAEYWVTGLRHGQAVLVHGPGTRRVLGYGVTAWTGCPGSWSWHTQSTGLRGYGMDRLSWFMVLAHAEYWVTGLRPWTGCPDSWSCHMQSTGLRGYGYFLGGHFKLNSNSTINKDAFLLN